MTRRMSAILGEYSPAGQGCTRHFSVPPLEYKNSTSYKKYRPNFGLNIQESYGKRPIFPRLLFLVLDPTAHGIFLLKYDRSIWLVLHEILKLFSTELEQS